MRIVRKSSVVFADEKLEKEFNKLSDDSDVKKWINRAIQDLKQNAFCGIPIPRRLIPKIYIQKFEITNLWKYDLPDGWRIIYSITTINKVEIISLILEWFNHNNYKKRFKY